jgi:hypothetical protein
MDRSMEIDYDDAAARIDSWTRKIQVVSSHSVDGSIPRRKEAQRLRTRIPLVSCLVKRSFENVVSRLPRAVHTVHTQSTNCAVRYGTVGFSASNHRLQY